MLNVERYQQAYGISVDAGVRVKHWYLLRLWVANIVSQVVLNTPGDEARPLEVGISIAPGIHAQLSLSTVNVGQRSKFKLPPGSHIICIVPSRNFLNLRMALVGQWKWNSSPMSPTLMTDAKPTKRQHSWCIIAAVNLHTCRVSCLLNSDANSA